GKSVFRLTLGPVVQYSDERGPLIGEDTLISADVRRVQGAKSHKRGCKGVQRGRSPFCRGLGTLSGGQCGGTPDSPLLSRRRRRQVIAEVCVYEKYPFLKNQEAGD